MTCGLTTLKKSAIALVLALLVAFGFVALMGRTVRADDTEGASGEGWTLSANGDLQITSSDAFKNNDWEKTSIDITSIYITAPTIPDYAFNQYTTGKYGEVKTLTINETVTSIGVGCFKEFPKLESVKYYPTFTKVPYISFYQCTNLKEIAFYDMGSVTEIGDMAFGDCTNLKTISLKGVTAIGDSAFSNCISLESVDLSYVETIGYGAFCGCTQLKTAKFNTVEFTESNVTSIGALAFKNCSNLEGKLDLSNVTAIPEEAFYNCSKIEEVTLWDAESVGTKAFYDCASLTKALMSDDTKSIGDEAFRFCANLENLGVTEQVISIGDNAFAGCTTLSSVDLLAIEDIGSNAFYGCTSLRSVGLGDNIHTISKYAFINCAVLRTINLSEIVTIGEYAFYNCSSLEYADLTNTETIGNHAFDGCTSLERIKLSYYLYSYEGESFVFDKVTEITFRGTKDLLEQWDFNRDFPNALITLDEVELYYVIMDFGTGYGNFPVEKNHKIGSFEPKKEGFTFTGWYTDKACTTLYDFDTPITADLHLYAGWSRDLSGVGKIIQGYSISLEGDIGVKFYTILPANISEDAYMLFTVQGISQTQKVMVSEAESITVKDVEYTVFKCSVPAKNMTSEISVDFIEGNTSLANTSYSIMRYANYIIDNENSYKDAAPVVKAMLNYGAYAQAYFNCNTAYPANAILNDGTDVSSVTAETLAAFATPKDTVVNDNITFSSVNLELESKLTMNMYFTGDLDGVVFKLNDSTVLNAEKLSDGRVKVSITGIGAEDIDANFKVSLYSGDTLLGDVTYSPMNYCYNVLSREETPTRTAALKDVIRALYLYNKAANEYV